MDKRARHARRRVVATTYLLHKRTRRYLPPVVRGVIGMILVILGFLGFLPVLGFWMIPLGLAVLATDLPPLGRWFRQRLNIERRRARR